MEYVKKDWNRGEIVTDDDVDRWELGIGLAHDEIHSLKNEVTVISGDLTGINQSVQSLLGAYNNQVVTTYESGRLTKVEEKSGTTVLSTSTLAYNPSGMLSTVTETSKGVTTVTTLNYMNGTLTSVSRQVI